MKLGIKVGPQRSSIDDLLSTKPAMCEVWFNIARQAEYESLFTFLANNPIDVGLHFWGVLPDKIYTNLSYPDTDVIARSMLLMRQTIDIAARHTFQYVNIHPGCRAKVALDLAREEFTLLSKPVPLDQSIALFLENAKKLSDYANAQGVVFTVETVPMRITDGFHGPGPRKHPKNIYELPLKGIEMAARAGIHVANDFGHTACNTRSDSPSEVFELLKTSTLRLAASTRLVHLSFIVPPYNGTDFHDVLDNPLLETDQAVPNKKQMFELLRQFQNRPDVWVLCEPQKDHVRNYFLAKEILKSSGVKFT